MSSAPESEARTPQPVDDNDGYEPSGLDEFRRRRANDGTTQP